MKRLMCDQKNLCMHTDGSIRLERGNLGKNCKSSLPSMFVLHDELVFNEQMLENVPHVVTSVHI